MSASLVFMMGEFEARFPTDRVYARNHMWAQAVGDSAENASLGAGSNFLFGFTSYAVRLLQDVYFLDWAVDAGAQVKFKQEIGAIESSKAESALYAPTQGEIVEFNAALLSDPSTINVDNHAAGWLFRMENVDGELLSPDAYLVHLEEAWKVAERTIKGQANL